MRAVIVLLLLAVLVFCATAHRGQGKRSKFSEAEFKAWAEKRAERKARRLAAKKSTKKSVEDADEEADFPFVNALARLKSLSGRAFLGRFARPTIAAPVADAEEEDEIESDSEISNGAQLQATTVVNIRNGPCTTNGKVGEVGQGSRVTYRGETRTICGYTWYRIDQGWVASNFFTEVSSQPSRPSGNGISTSQLRAIMPLLTEGKANEMIGYLNAAMNEFSINSCARRSAFLAQLAHESGQLRWFEEFASGAAYEGRKDLGNTQPGDGVRYKGRGPIQLTGRANYRSAGQALGLNLEGNPTQASQPSVGFRIAGWFWSTRSLNSLADQNNQGAFDQITRRINGGTNGKADRDQYWRKAKSVLGC